MRKGGAFAVCFLISFAGTQVAQAAGRTVSILGCVSRGVELGCLIMDYGASPRPANATPSPTLKASAFTFRTFVRISLRRSAAAMEKPTAKIASESAPR